MKSTWQAVYPNLTNDARANKWLVTEDCSLSARIVGSFLTRDEADAAAGGDEYAVEQFGAMLCDWMHGEFDTGPHNTEAEINAYFDHLERNGATL